MRRVQIEMHVLDFLISWGNLLIFLIQKLEYEYPKQLLSLILLRYRNPKHNSWLKEAPWPYPSPLQFKVLVHWQCEAKHSKAHRGL